MEVASLTPALQVGGPEKGNAFGGTIFTKEVALDKAEINDEPMETITDFFLSKVHQNPDTKFVSYPATAKGGGDYVDYSLGTLDAYAEEAAHQYASHGLVPKHPAGEEAEVIAMLVPSNLDTVVSILALSRMGWAILFLSNRLPNEAFINLLEKTKSTTMLVGSANMKTANEINTQYPVTISPILEQHEYQNIQSRQAKFSVPRAPNAGQRTSFIIHSSGSTGLPKPIFQTHRACLSNYSSGIPYRAFLTLPLYHNHGISTLFRGLAAGRQVALYNSNLPLSGTTLTQAMEAVKPDSFHCVPYALKLLSETERGVEMLKRCKLVLFGGSSCPDDLGDTLVDAGVYLVGHYGATEMGQLMTSFRDSGDKYWNYLRPLASTKSHLNFEPVGNDTYECIVLDGLPSKVMSNSDDPPNSYRTRDTFAPHPTIPDAWKYIGRLDDRVTLVNGEKVLPIPYENRVRQNELVGEAVVFGVGRAVPGLFIVPSEHARGLEKKNLFDQIWPTIENANTNSEAFGRISPEMVEMLDIGQEYPRTDKGTVIRAPFYRQFDGLIDAIYERFENPQDGDDKGASRQKLSEDELVTYLVDLFRSRINIENLQVSTDFFDAGVDSLQAITARAYIMREVDLAGQKLAQNVIFEHPNIQRLAKHIHCLGQGQSGSTDEDEVAVMEELIHKYSDFTPRAVGQIQPDGESVIVTGATGSLGAHVVAQLVRKPQVKKVWCLVRASSPLAAQLRVLSTLQSKGISGLEASHLAKITCLPADLSQPSLGLSQDVTQDMNRSLTAVLHSAWAVNFNLGVRSFETHHIKGTYNLLKFCLGTETVDPARLFFFSSVSAAAGTPIPATVPETYTENLAHAQHMGYARSKIVTENIVKSASDKTGMRARVLRLGQIIGDTENGMWNTTEAIPLMLQSAKVLKALPSLDETPSWMPVDLMAQSCIELSGLSESGSSAGDDSGVLYQVQNLRTFHWTRDLLPALKAAGLEFDIVQQREWVRLLRESNPDPVVNPTFKLLDFFTGKYDNDKPGRAGLVFESSKTAARSGTVENGYDVVDSGLMAKIANWWETQW